MLFGPEMMLTPNIILSKTPDADEKYALMQDDARYEVSDDADAESTVLVSSGKAGRGNRSFKVQKMFLAGRCSFNCAYCGCRSGREGRADYCASPRELAEMAVKAAGKNCCGIFISSAIYLTADRTQELLAECLRIMREELSYTGFVHAKVMPGADSMLIKKTGMYADRLSINIEVADSTGYEKIAKQKNRSNILLPMRDISQMIYDAKNDNSRFATSQTTQIMAGSTQESDRKIMILSEALYSRYRLQRVYYTPYHYMHDAKGYEKENLRHTATPLWRMRRLYQADRLMQLYGYTSDDVTPAEQPYLEADIDPKSSWALRHIGIFPIEINKADYITLLRIPGIGITYAKRILETRRHHSITHELLEEMKIPLKKPLSFITCRGRYKGGNLLCSGSLRDYLSSGPEQLSLFDPISGL